MQTPSGHCRCKKTQTPSRHEPKTAQTASQKTVSRYLWNPHKTIFGATEHKPSLCKHKPMQTPSGHCRCKKTQTPSRHEPKTAQTASQKTVSRTFGIHINNLWSHRAHAQPMQTPSGHCRCKKTQTPSRHEPKTAQTASQKTVSRGLDGVWVFLHLQCPDGVCIGWACALWLQSCFMWFQMVFHRLGMCSVAPKIVLCGVQR